MSVFEELIDELKEENLLEETIFSLVRDASPAPVPVVQRVVQSREGLAAPAIQEPAERQPERPSAGRAITEPASEVEAPDERETYRRQAMEEVSTLQTVEHVLSGIEREHMKINPASFNDLAVKKSLHEYLKVTGPINSDEHSAAEFQLFLESGKWFEALSKRDANISIANVRRFCENSRPVLSSQALMALARFYRNSPYAEAVRGKFDFVITRLFSREIGDSKRKLMFGRTETLGHLKTLYSNWASLAVADQEGGRDPRISTIVSSFEGFLREIESADSFEQLISSDFFNRVRLFKEQTNELFYDPSVTAAAIECNVKIGNRFVDLIQKERESTGLTEIEEKYGYSHDTIISHAASKTLLIIDLLRESREVLVVEESHKDLPVPEPEVTEVFEPAPVEKKKKLPNFSVSPWTLGIALVAVLIAVGLYFWSENTASSQSGQIAVTKGFDLSGSDLKHHIREASVSSETLYGITEPTWDALSDDEKRSVLSKAFQFATSKGLKRVNFLNSRGRTVAYASENRLEVFASQ